MSRVTSLETLKYPDLVSTAAQPPHNMEAEQGLLGTLLLHNRQFDKLGHFLKAEHFYVPVHARIFTAIARLVEQGHNASPVTLKPYFQKDEDLETLGGAAYLADLAACVITSVNTEDYARAIHRAYLYRQLIDIAYDIQSAAHHQALGDDPHDLLQEAESRLYSLAEKGEGTTDFQSLRDSALSAARTAEKAFQAKGALTGITTGLPSIDAKLGGLQKSDLIILAARPSMGKTSLAVNIAYNAAKRYAETKGQEGAVVGFFSLEMSSDQLSTRILSDLSEVSSDTIRRGVAPAHELRAFVNATNQVADIPLYIDQSGLLSIAALRAKARRLKRRHGLSLLIVDYLQLMTGTGSFQSQSNRVAEVSEITRGLKAVAKELDVPVLALSQLSRAPELRDDKRPQLSDLRESGAIEQDADVVMFLFREEYYLSRAEPELGTEKHLDWQAKMATCLNTAEAIIAKQRHGPVGTIKLNFDPNLTRFSER